MTTNTPYKAEVKNINQLVTELYDAKFEFERFMKKSIKLSTPLELHLEIPSIGHERIVKIIEIKVYTQRGRIENFGLVADAGLGDLNPELPVFGSLRYSSELTIGVIHGA